jgi:hypothetical protein
MLIYWRVILLSYYSFTTEGANAAGGEKGGGLLEAGGGSPVLEWSRTDLSNNGTMIQE